MSLFVCTTPDCRTIENTALVNFASKAYGLGNPECSACEGEAWHGIFPRRRYDPDAPIGSESNPERLWVNGKFTNEPPRRVGTWVHAPGGVQWKYDDGFGDQRPYTWVGGVAVWNDELELADTQA